MSQMPFNRAHSDPTLLPEHQKREYIEAVKAFPEVLDQAVADYAKFKVALKAGTVSQSQYDEITKWFFDFPKLWEYVRPNFIGKTTTGMHSSHQTAMETKVENFVAKLKSEKANPPSLGLVITAAVAAGFVIAAIWGGSAVIWSIGYVKNQNNISQMIRDVADKKIPASILEKAIDKEESSLIGTMGDTAMWIAIAIGAVVAYPYIKRMLSDA